MSIPTYLKYYHIVTYGCQMNVHDTERITGMLNSAGMQSIDNIEDSDLVIFNTCSVRLKAEEKFFTAIGRLKQFKKEYPSKKIIVAGCTAQASPNEIKRRAPHVDLVMGPRSINRLIENMSLLDQAKTPIIDTELDESVFENNAFESNIHLYDRPSPVKAHVTIMEGCNNHCAYCIVPYTRGGEVYRPEKQIIEEVERLAENGYLEIILLGQNVNAYKFKEVGFANLLENIAMVPGIERVRFITSHPAYLDDETILAMSKYKTICPQLHLPLQAGSNVILKAMNRKYTKEFYLDRVNMLKNHIKDISLSTDIIVGFPGETKSDFQQTMDMLEMVRYDQAYSFVYSIRPYTPAAEFEDNIDIPEKKKFLYELQGLHRKIQMELNKADIGKILPVLVDGFSKKDPEWLMGRSPSNKVVNFKADKSLFNKIIDIKIINATQNSLIGECILPA